MGSQYLQLAATYPESKLEESWRNLGFLTIPNSRELPIRPQFLLLNRIQSGPTRLRVQPGCGSNPAAGPTRLRVQPGCGSNPAGFNPARRIRLGESGGIQRGKTRRIIGPFYQGRSIMEQYWGAAITAVLLILPIRAAIESHRGKAKRKREILS